MPTDIQSAWKQWRPKTHRARIACTTVPPTEISPSEFTRTADSSHYQPIAILPGVSITPSPGEHWVYRKNDRAASQEVEVLAITTDGRKQRCERAVRTVSGDGQP
ncbi:hypothetical protein [Gordonia terrae]